MTTSVSNRTKAAKKARATTAARKAFVDRFGLAAFQAIVAIVQNRPVYTSARGRSLAAYQANLTRGAYSEFITMRNGNVVKDTAGLTRVS